MPACTEAAGGPALARQPAAKLAAHLLCAYIARANTVVLVGVCMRACMPFVESEHGRACLFSSAKARLLAGGGPACGVRRSFL